MFVENIEDGVGEAPKEEEGGDEDEGKAVWVHIILI